MGRYYKIVLSFVLAIFMMTNTIFAYGEKSLNIINITHLFKQIQQIKFAQLESSTLQSQYKFDLSENTMDKKLVKITIPNLQDTKNKSIKDYSTLANNTQQTKEAEKEDTEECQQVMNLSDEQINLLSKLVAAEARGESYEGQVAVAAVVLNRVQDSRFPDSIEGVIYQKNAFSVVRNGYIKAERTEESDKAVKDALYSSQRTSSPLIESITNLCIPKRSGAKVKSIITYNFDDLIEESLSKVKLEYKTIYRDEEQHDSDELPIYHVHGFIPGRESFDREASLVFSEEAYHKVYSEPYHWSNLVQLATLRENNCLMIGLSLSDPNLRRLLEIAAQKQSKNCRHYAFIQRLSNDSLIDDSSCVKINEASVNKILQTHHIIQEKMMESLGTRVIWFEDYSEIPVLLDEIRK